MAWHAVPSSCNGKRCGRGLCHDSSCRLRGGRTASRRVRSAPLPSRLASAPRFGALFGVYHAILPWDGIAAGGRYCIMAFRADVFARRHIGGRRQDYSQLHRARRGVGRHQPSRTYRARGSVFYIFILILRPLERAGFTRGRRIRKCTAQVRH